MNKKPQKVDSKVPNNNQNLGLNVFQFSCKIKQYKKHN